MDAKKIAKVWKAIASCASDDATRAIAHVCVVDDKRIEATDGHIFIRYDAAQPHGLAAGLYDCKKTLALIRAGVSPTPEPTEAQWPHTEAVIQSALGERTPAAKIGMTAIYMGTVLNACAVASDAEFYHVTLELGGELDPIVIRASGDRGTALGLIMPVRL